MRVDLAVGRKASLGILLGSICLFVTDSVQAQVNWTIESKPLLDIREYNGNPLGRVAGATTLSNGSIVIADNGNLRLYSFGPDGKPRAVFGKLGGGPGEFRSMEWVGRCGGDTVTVVDPGLQRITRIDGAGRLVSTSSARVQMRVSGSPGGLRLLMPAVHACAVNNRHVLLGGALFSEAPADGGPYRSKVPVAVSSDGNVFTQVAIFPGIERFRYPTTDGPRMLGKATLIAATPTRFFVGSADSFFVEIFGYDGSLKGSIRGPYGDKLKRLTKDDQEEWIQRGLSRLPPGFNSKDVETKVRQQLDRFHDFPETLPAFQSFLVDGENLWVEEGHRLIEPTRVWWGFDINGRNTHRLILPEALELYEITGNHVLGKWTDQDGVESVHKYRLVQIAR